MENIRRAYDQYFYHILVAGIAIGFILGLIPLYLGIKRNQRRLGFIALILSMAAGAVSPVLVVVLVAVFSFLITRYPRPVDGEVPTADDTAASAVIEEDSDNGAEAASSATADDENA